MVPTRAPSWDRSLWQRYEMANRRAWGLRRKQELSELVTREIYNDMEDWGIEVVNIELINLVQARPYRLIVDRNSRYQPIE